MIDSTERSSPATWCAKKAAPMALDMRSRCGEHVGQLGRHRELRMPGEGGCRGGAEEDLAHLFLSGGCHGAERWAGDCRASLWAEEEKRRGKRDHCPPISQHLLNLVAMVLG